MTSVFKVLRSENYKPGVDVQNDMEFAGKTLISITQASYFISQQLTASDYMLIEMQLLHIEMAVKNLFWAAILGDKEIHDSLLSQFEEAVVNFREIISHSSKILAQVVKDRKKGCN